jgi:predicted ATPase
VLWIDDAHWGVEALAFAWYVLRAQQIEPADVLLLLCLQGERMKDDDEANELICQIGKHSSTTQMMVPPLSTDSQEHLLADLLGLERSLAHELARGSGGNPLFATQLMGDWVRRGVLEPGPWGFRLREGEGVSIPADLSALWDQRIDQAVRGLGSEAMRALVVAAAFGGRVETGHFGSVCSSLGFAAPDGLADRLYEEHLAVPSKGGWSFVHDGLQIALKRRASIEGTWEAVRRAVQKRRVTEAMGTTTTPVRARIV